MCHENAYHRLLAISWLALAADDWADRESGGERGLEQLWLQLSPHFLDPKNMEPIEISMAHHAKTWTESVG